MRRGKFLSSGLGRAVREHQDAQCFREHPDGEQESRNRTSKMQVCLCTSMCLAGTCGQGVVEWHLYGSSGAANTRGVGSFEGCNEAVSCVCLVHANGDSNGEGLSRKEAPKESPTKGQRGKWICCSSGCVAAAAVALDLHIRRCEANELEILRA